jgi:CRISPR-associated endonuclease/helicase Cas3
MESTLPSSDLYSHPGKPLEAHLISVAEIAQVIINDAPIEFGNEYSKDKLKRVAYLCGLTHDIGKSTPYFQDYLSNKSSNTDKSLTKHSLLSSIVTFAAIKKEFPDDWFLQVAGFLAVRHHHSDLRNVVSDIIIDDDKDILYKQIESIDKEKLKVLSNILQSHGLPFDILINSLKQMVSDFSNPTNFFKLKRKLRRVGEETEYSFYLIVNLLYSSLLDADKTDVVIGTSPSRADIQLTPDLIDRYKLHKNFKNDNLNALREQLYNEVLSHSIDVNQKIYSLTAPTGLGKTFTVLSFAFKLREKLKQEKNFTAHIIYSLPFLSIIDQNASEIENIFNSTGIMPTSGIFLKHHHLSEIKYETTDDELSANEAEILIEGWHSEIIITTFMQLFFTLLSNRKSTLRRLNKLAGSIIILDEVQSIPVKYWLITKEIITEMAKTMNCYFIFVTATQPLILDSNAVSLAEPSKYTKGLNRVVINVDIGLPVTIEEFTNKVELKKSKTYLFILNTISSTKQLYNILNENASQPMTFLSTHVIPKERLKRIMEIREGKWKIAVTTQLVEAGVDIDFEIVYRDIAPFDSIVQSAGRCNRNGQKNGEMFIVNLKDERKSFSRYIYDSTLLDATERILKDKKEIKEGEFLELVYEYYKIINELKSQDESKSILDAVYRLKYTSNDGSPSIESFNLIDDKVPRIDIFVEIDDEAKAIFKKFQRLKEIKEIFERRAAFREIKSQFYQFVISVPKTVQNIPPIVSDIYYVNFDSLKDYYDMNTGYITKGAVAIW